MGNNHDATMTTATDSNQPFDVIIIGAGLSGIGAACHLQRECPTKRYAILERRSQVGGTWDLFRYPGIRSDSDMFTFGYHFRPWVSNKVLADGPSIREYVRDTADEFKVDDKIQFNTHIQRAVWNSDEQLWTLHAEVDGKPTLFRSRFISACTGYYDYDEGFMPQYEGVESFNGQMIHPQHWPEDLDYSDKKVIVIGSGATAVTIVPAMTDKAGHVTMLQRSPTYIFTIPGIDKFVGFLLKWLPTKLVYPLVRLRNMSIHKALYKSSLRWPDKMRRFFLKGVHKQLPPEQHKHFDPTYAPWDQRLCAVPDGDLFTAIRNGKASVVTDHIDRFTETGILLKSGGTLEADIVISATGLNIQLLGGMDVEVDGETREPKDVMSYKAVMIQDAPNMAVIFGYTNAPWTLKADIANRYLCRLINHMDEHGYTVAVAREESGQYAMHDETVFGALKSGYVERAVNELPRQGNALPWRVLHDYKRDKAMLLKEPLEDGVLQFSRAPATSGSSEDKAKQAA